MTIRLLTAADLNFADELRKFAGWNQTLPYWRRFLALSPEGCFLASCEGASAGVATTTIYGRDLAWIGTVLVHPDYRRAGLGRALVQQCLDYLRGRGISTIKLDATALGQKVYEPLGFREETTLTRWEREAGTSQDLKAGPLTRCEMSDLPEMEAFDAKAFGVSRGPLLAALASQSRALLRRSPAGAVCGFGMVRPGSRALYLGPLTALDPFCAEEIARRLLGESSDQPFFWDLPDRNQSAVALAQRLGFKAQRNLIRMLLGPNRAPGEIGKQFGIAGPETG